MTTMDSTELTPLLGKNVVAQGAEGRIFAGKLQRSLGQFEILSGGHTHHMVFAHDLLNLHEASEEEVEEMLRLCNCDAFDLNAPECPVHMTEEMRDIIETPKDNGVCLEVPSRTFQSARIKLNRASRVMLRLQRDKASYEERSPRTMETIKEGDMVNFVFRVVEEMPDEIPALASAAIHNLRSCLDSIAWDVSRKTKSTLPETQITFTVRETKANLLSTDVQKKILRTGGKDWLDFINRISPCEDGNEVLWILHRLDIMDKHRDLIEVQPSPVGFQTTSPPEAKFEIVKGTGFYEDGDVIAQCRKGYDCSLTLNTRLALKDTDRFRADDIMDALRIMHNEVCKVLLAAEKQFP